MQTLLIALLLLGSVATIRADANIDTSSIPIIVEARGSNCFLTVQDPAAGLISITADDAEMHDLINLFAQATEANIIATPADIQGRVTVRLDGVHWRPALDSILSIHNLEIVEKPVGTGVYVIGPRQQREQMAHLLFRPPGDTGTTNRITLNLTNALPSVVLHEVAKQAHLNIAYAPSIDHRPPITMTYTNVDSCEVLQQLASILELGLDFSARQQCYNFGIPQPIPRAVSHTNKTDANDAKWLLLFPLAAGILFMLLSRRRRKEKPDQTPCPVPHPGPGVLLLSVVYGVLLFEALFAGLLSSNQYLLKLLAGGTFLGLIGFAVFWKIVRHCPWRPTGRKRLAAWLAALLPLWFFFADSPPLKGDYSWDDLPVPAQHAEESFALASRLWGTHAVHFEPLLPAQDLVESNAALYATQIDRAWSDARECREIVAQLNRFDAIADLTRPTEHDRSFYAWTRPSPDPRNLHQTYHAHIRLELARGNLAEAVRELAEWHTCLRKALPYKRKLIEHMLCVAFLQMNIELAHEISLRPDCTEAQRAELRTAFPPIPYRDISLRNSLLVEYLGISDAMERLSGRDLFATPAMFKMTPIDGTWIYVMPRPPTVAQGLAAEVIGRAFVRKNRTRDGLRQVYQIMMEMQNDGATHTGAVDQWMEEFAARPDLTNPGGWLFIRMATPSFDRATETCLKVDIKSHLLALELVEPAGQVLHLKDPWSGQAYRLDGASGRWISAGPDGEFYTTDDIRLGLAP